MMIDAHKNYGRIEYLRSIEKAGDFIILSQLPPPQSGWAQQYNHYLQPAWARAFEPPSVCSSNTVRNINTLIDLYLYTGRAKYLEPIPDAIRWLKESILPNGRWARFYELGTNQPLYYDRGRKRVSSTEELSIERRTGYAYEVSIGLENTIKYYDEVIELGREGYLKKKEQIISENEKMKKLKSTETTIRDIISSQDEMGRWIVKDKYRYEVLGAGRWNGEYKVEDRIKSRVFINNIELLCDYIELAKSLDFLK